MKGFKEIFSEEEKLQSRIGKGIAGQEVKGEERKLPDKESANKVTTVDHPKIDNTDNVKFANAKIQSGIDKVTKASDDLKSIKDFGSSVGKTKAGEILNAIVDESKKVLSQIGK